MPPARIVVALFALLIALAGCGTATTQPASVAQTPVIVDTDMSWDDITALVYLLQRPDVHITGITIAGDGLTHCDPGVAHVRQLVAYLGHAPLPVGCGREVPLKGSAAFPSGWRASADGFFGLTLPPVPDLERTPTAVGVLDQALVASPKSVVISLAPMTNLAETLTLHPNLRGRIQAMYAMAGALDVPGNESANGRAEWNVYIDPLAAQAVLASGVPITLVPLDASDDVPVTLLFKDALNARQASKASKLISTLLSDPYYYTGSQYFWDPAAVVIAMNPDLAQLTTMRLAVVQDPGPDHGRTVRAASGTQVRVAIDVQAAAFYQGYLRGVLGDPHFEFTMPTNRLDLSYSASGWSASDAMRPIAGPAALSLTNDTPSDVGVVVAQIARGHTVSDVDAAIRAKVTIPPPWFQVVLQVTLPRGHPATWGVDLESGMCVVIGGGPDVPLQRLAAIEVP